ncbi:outer membrane beta-barrel protein [Helicobacter pylori E48]|nr:outer membrane beta-barrel protein [Helicobacter pylori E48]
MKESLKFRAKISHKIPFIACNTKLLFIKEKSIQVGVKVLRHDQHQLLFFMGAKLKYRRLYSVYLNYVFAY